MLYLPVGLPGCGKSTYYREYFNWAYYTSADVIRQELAPGVVYDPEINNQVFGLQRKRLGRILEDGNPAYVDNTNIHAFARRELYELAASHKTPVHVILFKNIEQAWARNNARTGAVSGTMRVSSDAMTKMEAALRHAFVEINEEPWTSLTVIESFGTKS